jgi:predicted nucleic acid-binding protein
LARPYFAARLHPQDVRDFVELLRTDALVVPLTATVQGVATHPEDDLTLATAVSGGAQYLVTSDRQLLRLGSYQAVTIVSPRQFLELLAQEEGEA